MTEQRRYFVSYAEELTADDREALTRSGWKLYENGIGSTAAYGGQEFPPVKWRQIIRVPATDEADARSLVVEALGREPAGLTVSAGADNPPD